MGAGLYGGFGNTKGKLLSDLILINKSEAKEVDRLIEEKQEEEKPNFGSIDLPKNESQLKHIFGNRPGHLPQSKENEKILVDLANDESKYIGDDLTGNSWNAKTNEDGTQIWVVHRNGIIQNGGINDKPRDWSELTGLNKNLIKKKGKSKQ